MAETQTEQPKFDPAAYQKQANEDEAARRNGKPLAPPIKEPDKPKELAKEATPAAQDSEEERDKRISRSDRRKLKFVEEAAYYKGKAEAAEALLDKLGSKTAPSGSPPEATDDPEPQRSGYSTDAEYNRALGRWDARQEAKKEVGKVREDATQKEQREAWEKHLREMDIKAAADIKQIPDWDEVAKKAAEDEDAIEWTVEDHPTLMGLIASSDIKARVLYHFAKHPEDLQKMLDLTERPQDQIRQFARLEGRIEKMYTSDEPKSEKAAQAVEETLKDRVHPAEAQAGRNSAERDASKPRPSTEVAARGGSAPPGDIRIGSPEWHQRENERERAMRGR